LRFPEISDVLTGTRGSIFEGRLAAGAGCIGANRTSFPGALCALVPSRGDFHHYLLVFQTSFVCVMRMQ
jgi:hypothetical protein